jgi:hypothetical protein
METLGITHVINCAAMVCPNCFPQDFSYKTFYLHDSPSQEIAMLLYEAFDFIQEAKKYEINPVEWFFFSKPIPKGKEAKCWCTVIKGFHGHPQL